MEACLAQTRLLFKPQFSEWCRWSHRGQCSFVGVYQPPLPTHTDVSFGQFVVLGGYYKLFQQLGLETATMETVIKLATDQCAEHLVDSSDIIDADEFCFLAAFAYSMAIDGHHFAPSRNFTAVDAALYRNQEGRAVKVGWPLGAMIYEINALPWVYDPDVDDDDDDAGGANDRDPRDEMPYSNLFVVDAAHRAPLAGRPRLFALVGATALLAAVGAHRACRRQPAPHGAY
mmetsp:Transcript_9662/g.33981  ORF Transcript_9662/g.33981 Transcript_9662/m.33981 type:complete len:230 (-) Transcript_9662:131-820(-)